MKPVHTAVGEMQRTAIDALRGLGFPFALAERVTHTLTWAEVVHGCGLQTIRRHEARIREAIPRAFGYSERSVGSRTISVLDAGGKITFESAPRAFDLADAGAKLHGIGLVVIRRTFGAALLGEFVMRSTERGLAVLVLCQPANPPAGAEDDPYTAILSLPDGGMKAATIAAADSSANVSDFAPLLAEIAEDAPSILGELSQGKPESAISNILIVSFKPQGNALSDSYTTAFDRCAAPSKGWQTDNGLLDRWRRAIDNGFEVDAADWKFMYSLVAQTRIVTSERSQSQAG
ncbi:MAG TPA: hypothetical protein VGM59_13275 [Dongiaceae bacterium]|jgi:hypothetical protein